MDKKIEIKNKHIFKNKLQLIIYLILFIFLISMFIYLGNLDYTIDITDNVRFAQDFNLVSEDNVFEYVNSQDANILLTKDKAIILFGFSKNDWVNNYAKIVNDVAISEGIDKIYYYDFLADRTNNNGTYQNIVNTLDKYTMHLDNGFTDIFAPTLVIIENHKVSYFDDTTAFIKGNVTPAEYWNEYEVATKKSELEIAFKNYLGS